MCIRDRVIATLEIRKEGEKYPAELIPVRLSAIYQINESYEWVVSTAVSYTHLDVYKRQALNLRLSPYKRGNRDY